MLDVIYGPTEAHPNTIASVKTLFNDFSKLGRDIERDKRPQESTPARNENTQDAMYLD